MEELTQHQSMMTDLVVSWLRSEIGRLNNALEEIININGYDDECVLESIEKAEIALRQMRKFIQIKEVTKS